MGTNPAGNCGIVDRERCQDSLRLKPFRNKNIKAVFFFRVWVKLSPLLLRIGKQRTIKGLRLRGGVIEGGEATAQVRNDKEQRMLTMRAPPYQVS